jgi:hypothetical protein
MLCTQAYFLRGRCLVDHAPSPQLCALGGGIWDDSVAATQEAMGGRCLSPQEAAARTAEWGIEALTIDLSHDPACARPAWACRFSVPSLFVVMGSAVGRIVPTFGGSSSAWQH